MAKPLAGLRVLDLCRVIAGPWSAQQLADLGAEVIKVERPGSGDDSRSWGAPFIRDREGHDSWMTSYFSGVNRGKKSVTLDFGREEGRELLRRLVAQSDILIENFRTGTLARQGLGYDALKEVNPRLIYCSITGFGQSGPYAQDPGYDIVFQGLSGMMSITGEPDGKPGAGPQKTGVSIVDVLGGLFATIGILGALEHRRNTGHGQYIDIGLLDVAMASLVSMTNIYLASEVPPQRQGNAHPTVVPYQVFDTRDGQLIVAILTEHHYQRLCALLGCPELGTDPRFASVGARNIHRETLIPMLAQRFLERGTAAWFELLRAQEIPCGPINDIAQAFADPQVRHRGMRVDIPHPDLGSVPVVASPIRYSETPVDYQVPPPGLGQDNHAIFRELAGLSEADCARLAAAGII